MLNLFVVLVKAVRLLKEHSYLSDTIRFGVSAAWSSRLLPRQRIALTAALRRRKWQILRR